MLGGRGLKRSRSRLCCNAIGGGGGGGDEEEEDVSDNLRQTERIVVYR